MKTKQPAPSFVVHQLSHFGGYTFYDYVNKQGDTRKFYPGTCRTIPSARFRTLSKAQDFVALHKVPRAYICLQSPPPPGESTYLEDVVWVSPDLEAARPELEKAGVMVPRLPQAKAGEEGA